MLIQVIAIASTAWILKGLSKESSVRTWGKSSAPSFVRSVPKKGKLTSSSFNSSLPLPSAYNWVLILSVMAPPTRKQKNCQSRTSQGITLPSSTSVKRFLWKRVWYKNFTKIHLSLLSKLIKEKCRFLEKRQSCLCNNSIYL